MVEKIEARFGLGIFIGILSAFLFPILTFTLAWEIVLTISIVMMILGSILMIVGWKSMKNGNMFLIGYGFLLSGIFWLVYLIVAYVWTSLYVLWILGLFGA